MAPLPLPLHFLSSVERYVRPPGPDQAFRLNLHSRMGGPLTIPQALTPQARSRQYLMLSEWSYHPVCRRWDRDYLLFISYRRRSDREINCFSFHTGETCDGPGPCYPRHNRATLIPIALQKHFLDLVHGGVRVERGLLDIRDTGGEAFDGGGRRRFDPGDTFVQALQLQQRSLRPHELACSSPLPTILCPNQPSPRPAAELPD